MRNYSACSLNFLGRSWGRMTRVAGKSKKIRMLYYEPLQNGFNGHENPLKVHHSSGRKRSSRARYSNDTSEMPVPPRQNPIRKCRKPAIVDIKTIGYPIWTVAANPKLTPGDRIHDFTP